MRTLDMSEAVQINAGVGCGAIAGCLVLLSVSTLIVLDAIPGIITLGTAAIALSVLA